MIRNIFPKLRNVALAGFALLGAAPAIGQDQPAVLQPETAVVSPGGVDMNTGQYRDEGVDLTMGSGANGGIMFKRVDQGIKPFTSNWHIFLNRDCDRAPGGNPQTPCTVTWKMESMAVTKTWLQYPPGPMVEQGIPSPGHTKLEHVLGAWRFTMADGTVIKFESSSSSGGDVWATSMTRKDGVVFTFAYDNGGDPANGSNRLRRVWSNTGYELILEYGSTGNDRIAKACVFNTSVVTPPPATTYVCPPAGTGVQAASYGYSDLISEKYPLSRVTDAVGKVWNTTVQSGLRAYIKPGMTSPWLTNTLGGPPGGGFYKPRYVVLGQQLADGRTIDYSYANLLIYESDPPQVDLNSGRGTGWTVNGTQTTQVGWAVSQGNMNGEPGALYISPAPDLMVDPLGRGSSVTYEGGTSPYGNALSKTLIGGRSETFTYSGTGTGGSNLASRTWNARLGTSDLTTSYSYDCAVTFNCAKPASITDPKGNISNYTYDGTNGLLLTETMPAAQNGGVRPQKRYTWAQRTARYKTSSGTFVNGASVWVINSISECRTSASCAGTADETLTTFAYPISDTANNILPVSKTVQAGNGTLVATTTFTYDAAGNKLTEDGPLPGAADTSRWQYDAKRRATHTMSPDPDGAGALKPLAVRNTYDDAGRLIKVENGTVPSQATTWDTFTVIDYVETDHDALDRKVQERKKDAAGTTQALTQSSYDSFGRLDCTAVRMNPAAYGSLPASACTLGTQGTNGPDRITRNTYDAGDQLLTVTEAYGTPDQAVEASYAYTSSGKKETLTDARGFKAQMVYDGHDRQTQWRFPDKVTPGVVSANDNEVYTYDNNGNRLTLKKRDGSELSFAYDNLNRMIQKRVPDTAGLSAATPAANCHGLANDTNDVCLAYDLQGHQTAAQFGASASQGLTSDFDPLGRVTSTTLAMDGVGRTLGYQHDLAGNLTRVTHPDGLYFFNSYDAASRLTVAGWRNTSSTTDWWLMTPVYDSQGRLQAVNRAHVWNNYGYDAVSRLGSLALDFAGSTHDVSTTFGYNPASQLASSSRDNDAYAWTGAVPVNRNYATNGLNQYTAAGPATFTHDLNGNLTNDGTNSYIYDVENRLVSASMGGSSPQTVTLRYDPMGRLYEVTGSVTGTTRFLYDGNKLSAEYDATGTLLRRYGHGPGIDQPVFYDEGSAANCSATYFLHHDRQGSVVAISDCGGALVNLNTYDEYGIPKSSDPNQKVVGRFAYTGQIWLPELGMYHYKARLYSPTLGRFMQTDPIGYDDQVNLYAYVGNDPMNKSDPSGTMQDSYELATQRDERALLSGKLTEEEFRDRQQARAGGGVAGGVIAGVAVATRGFGVPAGIRFMASRFANTAYKQTASKITQTITRDFNRGKASGLAKAIRSEVTTGKPTGGKFHIQKGIDAVKWAEDRMTAIGKDANLSSGQKEALTNAIKTFQKEVEEALNAPLPN